MDILKWPEKNDVVRVPESWERILHYLRPDADVWEDATLYFCQLAPYFGWHLANADDEHAVQRVHDEGGMLYLGNRLFNEYMLAPAPDMDAIGFAVAEVLPPKYRGVYEKLRPPSRRLR